MKKGNLKTLKEKEMVKSGFWCRQRHFPALLAPCLIITLSKLLFENSKSMSLEVEQYLLPYSWLGPL